MRKILQNLFATFFAVSAAIFPRTSLATTVTDITDQVSSSAISAGSNHKFILTLGDTFSEGETLQIVFPTGFVLTSLTENDVDITDDGVDLLTEADCSGSDQASVAISGQTITMTICVGDGGTIANGSVVTVEIGTNASSSGSGTNQTTNPSSAGSWFVNLTGTSGNSGSVILATSTNSGAAVSATVPSPASPPPPTDPGDQCAATHGNSCESSENSCGMTNLGSIFCDGSCSASTPSDSECSESCVINEGESCTSSANSCGMTNDGAVECDGNCSASVPSDGECSGTCSISEGESCTSDSNSCGMENTGTIACDGSCSASDPSEDLCTPATSCSSDEGSSCTSSENSCGMTSGGVVACSGACSASAPSDGACPVGSCSVNEGEGCTSNANSCGMVNAGTIGCDGNCSASGPSENLCTSDDGSCDSNEGNTCTTLANSCGITNTGTVSCSGVCSAETPPESLCDVPPISSESNGGIITPSKPVPTEESPVTESGSIAKAVVNVASALEDIRALSEVRRAVDVAIPVAATAAVVTAIVLASSFGLLSYLQFLFTSPFLFFARRKRKAFGIVFNSITKVAVDLATVRLYDVTNNRLVRSMVTDTQGKYFFIVNPGQYRITVTKNGFTFPSVYLHGVKDDGVFLDVYTGQTVEVSERDATIAANIPLDPEGAGPQHTQRGMILRRLLRKIQFIISLSGVVLSFGVWFFSPSIFAIFLVAIQVVVFLFFWRLARPRRPSGWGIVFDASNHRPVGNAVVRLFEPKYNKLVETVLTDALGRYSFFVGPNEYFVQANKDGYDQHIIPSIDYRRKTEPDAIAIDVPLTPTKPV